MSYTDAQNQFSSAQSIVGAGATTVSTNVIDLLSANRNVGRGYPKRIQANMGTAGAGGTSIQAQVIGSANSNMSSPTVLATGPTVLLAAMAAGAEILDVPMPDTTQRYLAVQYVTVGTFTTGTVGFAGVVEATDNFNNQVAAITGY